MTIAPAATLSVLGLELLFLVLLAYKKVTQASIKNLKITRVSRDGSAKKCHNKGTRNHDLTDKVHPYLQFFIESLLLGKTVRVHLVC